MQRLIKRAKTIVFTLALALGLAVPVFAGTASAADLFSGAKGEACKGAQLSDSAAANCTENDQAAVSSTLQTIINLLSVVVGMISVVMIVISGLRFVTANGDSNNITTAKNTFIYALVGLVIVALAQMIVKLVLTKV